MGDSTIEQEGFVLPPNIEPETAILYKRIQMGAPIEELQKHLDRDPKLEGFLNAAAFERRLGNLLKKGVKGVLMAVDMDYFKQFNDSQGHLAGDRLITLAAELLHNQTRTHPPTQEQKEQRLNLNQDQDLLGRLGGDEFAVFFVGAERPDAIKAAERVRSNIVTKAREAFPSYSSEQTMSIGLAPVMPNDTTEALRERADQALYKAKEGKDNGNVADSIAIA